MATTKNERDHQQQAEFSSKISDEINCSICLDILVNPLTLVPCGHSFCTNCCLSESTKNGRRRRTLCFTKCPHCRQPIKETAPSRQLESLIDTLVTVPNLLFRNEDDKQQYLKRKELETERCPIVVPTCKTKKRRRQEDQYPNYNDYTTISRAAPPPLSNHYNHVRQNNAYNFFASATTATTNRHYSAPAAASNFDPMVAPLPPPYDFTGPIPSFSEPRFSEPPELPPEPSSGSRGYTNTTAVANTSGVSASDPICID